MKTTVHIPDALLAEAQALAKRERTTLKALVQEGLGRVVAERRHRKVFRLRDASFAGNGLQAEFADADWSRIRAAIYEERGA